MENPQKVDDCIGTNGSSSMRNISECSDKDTNKKLFSEQSFEVKSIDKYYTPKTIYGTNIPELSAEDLKQLDPECKHIKKVLILYTGGTIGMCKVDGVYEPKANYLGKALSRLPMFNDSEFRKAMSIPNNIFVMPRSPDDIRVVFNVWEYNPLLDSSDMTMDDYIRIAKDIHSEYEHYDGFIILHGTDTMSFTGSALSFLLENLRKPVILTGSQIPVFEIRSDGRENLLAALIIASHYNIPEVTLYFHEKLFRANRTSKLSSVHFDAFDSPNYPPLADVGISIKVHSHRLFLREKTCDQFKVHTDLCPDVSVLKMFPSITCDTVKAFLAPPVKGVVLLSYGSGNMPFCRKDLLDLFKEAYNRDCIIINISQCWKGGVKAIYRTGFILKEYGIYPGLDMTLEAALSKLSYVLARSDWSIETKRSVMSRNLCGELTLSEAEITREQRSLSQDGIIMDEDVIIGAVLCSNAKAGNVAAIEQMGKRRGNLDATDYNGRTALHVAALENQIEVVRFLIEKGAKVNKTDHHHCTPLKCAVLNNSKLEVIREIRNSGGNIEMTNEEIFRQIEAAVLKNDIQPLLLFIEAGIDINIQDENRNSLLHLSSIYGRLNFVKALLDANCDPHLKNNHNNIAYDEALVRDKIEICKLLSQFNQN